MSDKVTLGQELRRRWPAYVFLAVVWLLVSMRVFGDHVPRLPLLYNATPSLPYTFAYMRYGHREFARGDYVIYRFDGPAQKFFPGVKGQPFFKMIRGVPGDRITVRERIVYINGEQAGMALQFGPKGVRLDPIDEGVIPAGYFYVQGTGRDSFDSRYKLSGLVRQDQVISGVVPIF